MKVIYADHRAFVEDDLGETPGHPFGGLLLSTGEAVGYDDPDLDVTPSDDAWDDAHFPVWNPATNPPCAACGRLRGPDQL